MISIEAWRCSIGSHNSLNGKHVFKHDNSSKPGIATGATFLRSSLGSAFMSAILIAILLVIGCVEINPGPKDGRKEGKNFLLM